MRLDFKERIIQLISKATEVSQSQIQWTEISQPLPPFKITHFSKLISVTPQWSKTCNICWNINWVDKDSFWMSLFWNIQYLFIQVRLYAFPIYLNDGTFEPIYPLSPVDGLESDPDKGHTRPGCFWQVRRREGCEGAPPTPSLGTPAWKLTSKGK